MGFKEAMNTVLVQKYATFQGRAARSEYWWYGLGVMLIALVLGGLLMAGMDFETGEMTGIGYVGAGLLGLFYLAIIIPSIAVMVRRFHDRNMSGWWVLGFILLSLIPLVGIVASIAQLVIFCLKGTDGENRFGADPLNGAANPDVFS
jgi:uncharacterized membrane protein YhaH (DUF805 family)